MIQVQAFTVNPFQENTYLLIGEDKTAILIDPGMYDTEEVRVVTSFLAENELTLSKILLTHAHLDHIFGLKLILDEYDVPFYLHKEELPVYENAESVAAGYGVKLSLPKKKYELISEKETISFNNQSLEVRFAPGHSPGSICFYSEKDAWVIGGDVLFQQSIGRTDLPGGDTATLLRSIQTQLFTLPDQTTVYSGHGPNTTIGFEKKNNPFFKG